jgi:hypothetical protein
MSELEKANSEQLIEKNSQAPSIANQALQVTVRAELEAKDLNNEEDYVHPSEKVKGKDTIVGLEAFRKKEYEERCTIFKDVEGAFSRCDNVKELFKDWEIKRYGSNLYQEDKIEEKPNIVFFALPKVQVTCGAAKFTENPPRPSDVKMSQKTLVRKERVNPVEIDESSEIKKSLMNGRLVSRISDLDSKEREARAKLREIIEPRHTLEDKLKKNG